MVYVASRSGIHHEVSEDAVLAGTHILKEASGIIDFPKTGFICVADGVGGNRGGAAAAQFVLDRLSTTVTNPERLRNDLNSINQSLIEYANNTPGATNMATTLTGIAICGGSYHLIHVGNTRAFIKQGRYLKQITSDHTTYHWLMSSGQYEAAELCNKNEITNCFGGANQALLAKLVVTELNPFSLMLLTSDGVHEYIDLDVLEDILSGEGSYEDKCETILGEAINHGSEDDMTIVVIVPSEKESSK